MWLLDGVLRFHAGFARLALVLAYSTAALEQVWLRPNGAVGEAALESVQSWDDLQERALRRLMQMTGEVDSEGECDKSCTIGN